MLFLDHLAFFNAHVFAALAVSLSVRLLNGNDAHLHRDDAAIDFDGAKHEVHVSLAAKHGKVAGFLNPARETGHPRTAGANKTSLAGKGVLATGGSNAASAFVRARAV